MNGMMKAIKRTPHMITSKVGMANKSSDPEFDELDRKCKAYEDLLDKFFKDCKSFRAMVADVLSSQVALASGFKDALVTTHPSIDPNSYTTSVSDIRDSLAPELEVMDSRILAPLTDILETFKKARKSMTKREHKLLDYDRFNNSLTKLRDKKDKSLKDESQLFKLESEAEAATADYSCINDACKNDLPLLFDLVLKVITPLYNSFYYLQLNVYYLMSEKLALLTPAQNVRDLLVGWEKKTSETQQAIADLEILQRGAFTSAMRKQQSREHVSTHSSPPPSRSPPPYASKVTPPPYKANTVAPPPQRSVAGVTSGMEKASLGSATANKASTSASLGKRPPPPPPTARPKALPTVRALYDFTPQADGDLGFKVGDTIEVLERTESSEDWWRGRLNGVEGNFPGNYVE